MGRGGRRALLVFGGVLIAGGLGHLGGVGRLFLGHGVPATTRVLYDLWIGAAHLIGGSAYVLATRAASRGKPWRGRASLGAVVMLAYTLPILPGLISRGATLFLIFPTIYALATLRLVVTISR